MYPRSVSEIYQDFAQRRSGLLRALTDDVEDLYQQCDPNRDNLCLYGDRNGAWSVDLPAEEVPPELPEPCLGVNFARDGMPRKDWLALLAVHSDSWLMAVAFFYAVKLDASGRSQLFKLINQHPTLFEVVTGRASKTAGPEVRPGSLQPPKFPGGLLANGVTAVAASSRTPRPSGRLLQYPDIQPALKGRQAELYWPDDNLWYHVEIAAINVRNKSAKIIYTTGEEEDLDLEEIVRDGHMSLFPL